MATHTHVVRAHPLRRGGRPHAHTPRGRAPNRTHRNRSCCTWARRAAREHGESSSRAHVVSKASRANFCYLPRSTSLASRTTRSTGPTPTRRQRSCCALAAHMFYRWLRKRRRRL